MKILIVGAGALGGFFGGKLLAAGRDVTFLVRPGRAKQLAATGGLVIRSAAGDQQLADPPLVQAPDLKEHYDLVILSCKAPALESCMNDLAPAVGPDTMILPLLNGMKHIDLLSERFGRNHVLGGRCFIFAALDGEGRVLLQGDIHAIDFGELDGGESDRCRKALDALSQAGFTVTQNPGIVAGMWEKWVMIASTAGATCLMRATIGDIVKAGAAPFSLALVREAAGVAAVNSFPQSQAFLDRQSASLSNADSLQSASLHKDMEKGLPIEADHIIGDLLARIPPELEGDFPLLRIVYQHLKTYETRRTREGWV